MNKRPVDPTHSHCYPIVFHANAPADRGSCHCTGKEGNKMTTALKVSVAIITHQELFSFSPVPNRSPNLRRTTRKLTSSAISFPGSIIKANSIKIMKQSRQRPQKRFANFGEHPPCEKSYCCSVFSSNTTVPFSPLAQHPLLFLFVQLYLSRNLSVLMSMRMTTTVPTSRITRPVQALLSATRMTCLTQQGGAVRTAPMEAEVPKRKGRS